MNELDDSIQNSLNQIKTKCIRRRVERELIEISRTASDNMLYVQSINFDEKGGPIVVLVDCINESTNVYEFYIGGSYPFCTPKIKINYFDYIEFLRIRSIVFQNLLKQITKMNCLCCESYLCSDRWSPAIRLTKIVEEIRMFRKYKRDIINKFYADKIKDQYLISDIDLDSWLF